MVAAARSMGPGGFLCQAQAAIGDAAVILAVFVFVNHLPSVTLSFDMTGHGGR